MYERWVEITPSGIKKSSMPLKQQFKELGKQLGQLKYMLHFHLKKTAYGSIFGRLWLVLEPLLQALLYYFLVAVVFGISETDRFFKIMIAITFWLGHVKMLSQAPRLFLDKSDVLSQISFPTRMILLEFCASHLLLFAIGLAGPLVLLLWQGIYPDIYWFWVIPIFLVQFVFSLALASFLAIVGTFVRDIANMIFFPMAIWWYASPGIYDVSVIPEKYKYLYAFNPFSYFLSGYHNAILYHKGPDVTALAITLGVSLVLLLIGLWGINKVKHKFYSFF